MEELTSTVKETDGKREDMIAELHHLWKERSCSWFRKWTEFLGAELALSQKVAAKLTSGQEFWEPLAQKSPPAPPLFSWSKELNAQKGSADTSKERRGTIDVSSAPAPAEATPAAPPEVKKQRLSLFSRKEKGKDKDKQTNKSKDEAPGTTQINTTAQESAAPPEILFRCRVKYPYKVGDLAPFAFFFSLFFFFFFSFLSSPVHHRQSVRTN
jgi:hypothetical protein